MSRSREVSKKQGKESPTGSLRRSLGSRDKLEPGGHRQYAVKGRKGLTQREVRMWRSTCFAIIGPNHGEETDALPAV